VVLCEDVADDCEAVKLAARLTSSPNGPSKFRIEHIITLSARVALTSSHQTPSKSCYAMRMQRCIRPKRTAELEDRVREALRPRPATGVDTEAELRRALPTVELRVHYHRLST